MPSLTLVCIRPISCPVLTLSPGLTNAFSILEYRLKYNPWRIRIAWLLEPKDAFRSADKTLSDANIADAMDAMLKELAEKLGAQLRDK